MIKSLYELYEESSNYKIKEKNTLDKMQFLFVLIFKKSGLYTG